MKKQYHFLKWAYGILAISLFIYVAIKAYLAGFTHDESITYMIATGDLGWPKTANNHLLNTELILLTTQLFGYAEWVLRLPNVLIFPLFLFFLYKICFRYTQNALPIVLAVPIFLFNPFVIQYFGMARGYGLALTLALMSMYYLFRSLSQLSMPACMAKRLSVVYWPSMPIILFCYGFSRSILPISFFL